MSTLVIVDREGNAEPFTDEHRDYARPRASPDGTRVAVEVYDAEVDQATHIWIVDVETGVGTPLTSEGARNGTAVWADNNTIVFASDQEERGRNLNIYRMPADGSRSPELLLESDNDLYPTDVFENVLVYHEQLGPDDRHILTLDLSADADAPDRTQVFLETMQNQRDAHFAPNGRWLAYSKNDPEDGILVRAFPRSDAPARDLSDSRGIMPVWSFDGDEIFYIDPATGFVEAARVETSANTVRRIMNEALFSIDPFLGPRRSGTLNLFDRIRTPAGERFVFPQTLDAAGLTEAPRRYQINFVVNWFGYLRERVPVP